MGLPDGLYWLKANPSDYLGVSVSTMPTPVRTKCVFDANGDGWTELFDELGASEIPQAPTNDVVKKLPFRRVMVWTNTMLTSGSAPIEQNVYYINPSSATGSGKTLDEMHDYAWGGQDTWAQTND